MSRTSKKRDERQKATNAPRDRPEPKKKPVKCDDPLTLLAEAMRPAHRRFAEGILAGQLGAKAALAAGFSETSARSAAYKLLRREDIRRYIRLAQREQAIAARVNLPAIVDRLWRTVTDENATVRAKEAAMKQLVRIVLAGQGRGGVLDDDDDDDGAGLTDAKGRRIEADIMGVRQR